MIDPLFFLIIASRSNPNEQLSVSFTSLSKHFNLFLLSSFLSLYLFLSLFLSLSHFPDCVSGAVLSSEVYSTQRPQGESTHTQATELHWVSKHKQVCSLSLSLFVHINVKVRIWLFEMKSCYHEQVAQRVIRRMIQCPSLSGLNTHTISCMCTHPLSMHFS